MKTSTVEPPIIDDPQCPSLWVQLRSSLPQTGLKQVLISKRILWAHGF